MNAVCIYVSAAQLVLQTDVVDATCNQRLLDLNRMLPHLRQLLSCVVCCRLLNDPFAPRHGRCQHYVCRLCVRGRKSLRPLCSICKDCQDFKTYNENRQLQCLLQCYKSLCEHLMGSSLFAQLSKQKSANPVLTNIVSPSIPLPQMSPQEFVLEGASYENVSPFSADLPRPIVIPRLQFSANHSVAANVHNPLSTSAATPLMPNSAVHMLSHVTQTAPKAATPPTSTAQPLGTPPPPPPPPPLHKTDPVVHTIPPTIASNSRPSHPTPPPPTLSSLTPSLTIKNIKSIVELSSAVQLPTAVSSGSATSVMPMPTSNATTTASTITYVRPNTSGVVVPIVSSSATTTAPLTIASAKLQSLNRQMAQARNAVLNACAADGHPPLSFKASVTPASSVTASSSMASATASASTSTSNSVSTCVGSGSGPTTNVSANTTTATITSQQLRNPPPIKTVSNGSAMYSVLYTGIGNKITIKRKTDGDEDTTQRKNASTSAPPPTVFRQMAKASNPKRRGCRCGNATPTPGKLTCCGQRCPCYVDSKSCIGCKCRGCRNPHRPDGGKVRPVIPELACYEIQMADESSSLSPSELPIATTVAATPSPPAMATAVSSSATSITSMVASIEHQHHQQQHKHQQIKEFNPTATILTQTPNALPQMNTTAATTTTTLIPLRNLQQFSVTTQHQAQHQAQVQTQTQTQAQAHTHTHAQVLSTSNCVGSNSMSGSGLQLENLQRESVLIQNAEGKYQVVNVFTTGGSASQTHHAHAATLQRSQTISQLQTSSGSGSGAGSNTTFLLPNVSPCVTASTMVSTPPNTSNLPQIIMQHQPHAHAHSQQHQHQTTHLHPRLAIATSTTSIGSSNNNSNSHAHLPLQVQQQLKQSNIITVHPICSNHTSTTAQSNMPLMTVASTPNTTITLSPIIVTSPNNYSAGMYADSSDDFVSVKNLVSTTNSCSSASPAAISTANSGSHILTVPMAHSSPLTLRAATNTMAGNSNFTTGATTTNTHLTPAMVEVIESNEL